MALKLNIDVGKFPKNQPIGSVFTTIGELKIYSITLGEQIALNEELGKPLKECEPTYFIKHFIRYTCFLESSIKAGDLTPAKTQLSIEDVSLLLDSELEKIAELYINGNEHLFKKQRLNKKEVGKETFVEEANEGKLSKNDNENFKEYLLRLLVYEEDEIKINFKKAFEGLDNFSKDLSDQIKKTLTFGEILKESNDLVSLKPKDFFKLATPKLPEMNFMSQENLLTKISSILNKLFNVSEQSKKFLIDSNENQMKIAGEIKKSSDSSTGLSKKNIKLTNWVIIISAISILFSAFVYWRSSVDSKIQRRFYQKNVNLIIGELAKINSNIIFPKNELNKKQETKSDESGKETGEFNAIKSRINNLENEILKLKKIIENQKYELSKVSNHQK